MLSPLISSPLPVRRASPTSARRHDCGRYGELTVRDICKVSGQRESTIYARINKGWSGDRLAAPKQPSHPPGRPRTNAMVVACRLGAEAARKGRLLTTREIQATHPMSRQAAERWRCALRKGLALIDQQAGKAGGA